MSQYAPGMTIQRSGKAASRDAPSRAPVARRAPEQSRGRLPLFLQRAAIRPRSQREAGIASFEHAADRAAESVVNIDRRDEVAAALAHLSASGDAASRANSEVLRNIPTVGESLPRTLRAEMEDAFGADFRNVRIHADGSAARVAHALGANAFTTGRDIYFNDGRFDPGSQRGKRLLAHELAHVIQQGSIETGVIQCDLMETQPTAFGRFEIDMARRSAPARVGMEGHIRFVPGPGGPYSTQIGLIQIANVIQRSGAGAGSPFDWSATAEADRNELMTRAASCAGPGTFVDVQAATHPRSFSARPEYLEQWGGETPGHNEYGWLRSPTDLHRASLYDYPWWPSDVDMEFQTVAKAADTQAVYGSLEWGFQVRSGAVGHEHVRTASEESTAFKQALERFRGYYAHEPIVLYFDTNVDTPIAGEEAKIRDVLPYLATYPDVRLSIDGYADERGTAAHNLDLSGRRATNVEALCLRLGVAPSRIDPPVGWGETTAASAGSTPHLSGSLRANRRVAISFQRAATTPVVGP